MQKKICNRITGWSLSVLLALGLFTYLTFVPSPTFAVTMPDPGELRTLSQIDTMQQMSQQICINSRENETKQLRDTRDDKSYWVTKLKDGNCWMTQNLGFDLDMVTASNPLTPENSNVTSNITSLTTIKILTPKDWSGTDSDTINYFYNPGNYVYNTADGKYKDTSECTSIQDNFDNPKCTSYFTKITSDNEDAVDMHYHIGNYYSWRAATVQQEATSSTTAPYTSICPKGWKLPTSDSGSEVGSFGYMLAKYGLENSLTGDNGVTIYGEPLYFVYGGYLLSSSFRNAGRVGFYWSSTPNPNSTSSAKHLSFNYAGVSSSASNARYDGMLVRCLAMGGWLDSYADPNDQANVAIVVAPVISIDVTKHADKMETDFTHVATDTITARVGSNLPYQVLISTEKSELTLSNDKKEDMPERTSGEEVATVADTSAPSIPMLQKAGKIEAGTSSWGIKKLASINDTNVDKDTTYSPVGIEPEKVVFYTSNSAATDVLNFPVAIAISSTIPFGTYSTQVTLTAVAN